MRINRTRPLPWKVYRVGHIQYGECLPREGVPESRAGEGISRMKRGQGRGYSGRRDGTESLGQRGSSSSRVAALSSFRGPWRDADGDLNTAGPGSLVGANLETATPSAGQGEGVGSAPGPHTELSINTYCQVCSLPCFLYLEQCLAQSSCSISRH